jgi:hypothetical protein
MAGNPSTVRTYQLIDSNVISAASAVFGALEVITETDCNDTTRRNIEAATEGAERCLAQLGLDRSADLAAGPWDAPPFARGGPPPPGGTVVRLRHGLSAPARSTRATDPPPRAT